MNKITNKVASVALTVTTVVSLSGFGSFVAVAGAQSVADLQSQIASLLAQITALQAQLNAASGSPVASGGVPHDSDLTVGDRGPGVLALQQWLNTTAYPVATSGVGSPGNETEFFGTLTRSSLSRYQAANNILPSSGYYGPITRSHISNLGFVPPPVVNPGTPPVTPGPVNNTGNLWVALGAGSPATGDSAIAGAGQVDTGRFAFTAPRTAGMTITGLTLQKRGVVSDSNISNLYLADANTGEIVAQFQSLTNGTAIFAGLNLQVNAGQTWTGELRLDLSTGANAGNTIAWNLTAVTTASSGAVTGLPVRTNALTVTTVSNPSISTVTLTANAVGSTIDAGTNSVLVSSWTANVTNSEVMLDNLQFTFVGSAAPGDIRNLSLRVNGTEVGSKATAMTETTFSFSGVELDTGNSTIEMFADVAGSPNRTFTFSLLQPYKAGFTDTEYNTGITGSITSTNQTTVTINTGSITTSVATDSPTQPIPAGASGVMIGKFTIFAAGEPVKIKWLDMKLTEAGSSAWTTLANVTDDVSNIRIIGDDGSQLGNNISTVASGTSTGQCTLASTTATCHFGTSSSVINYTIPANTTRVLTVLVDVGSSTDMSTLQASLVAGTSNLEGQISFTSASSGAADGSTLAVTSSPLTIALNSAFNAPTFIAGSQNVKIASFVVTASSAQGAKVSSLTFDKDSNANFDMQNLKVMVGSTQFGTTRATIGDAETSLAFSGATPVSIPQGGSVTFDLYADILQTSTAATHSAVMDVTGWSALGNISNSAITFPGAVSGQSIVVSSGPTLTVALASDTPAAQQLVMGSTDNELAKFRFTADNVDDIRITDINFTDTITSGAANKASYQNLSLWDGTTRVAGPLAMTLNAATSGSISFSLNPVVVPKNGTKVLSLKGDVATFSSGGAVSGSSHVFKVEATTKITAKSVGNGTATVTISGTPSGNAQSVYRTRLALSASSLGATSNRARQAVDNVATFNFTADSAYQAVLGTVTLTISGGAITSGGTAFTVDLIDNTTNALLGSATQQTCTPIVGNTCSVTFAPAFIIDAGATKATTVRWSSASFTNAANASDAASVIVNATTDVEFEDGTTIEIPMPATTVPLTVSSVSYE